MRRLLFVLPALVVAVIGLGLGFGLTRDAGEIPSALIDKKLPKFDLAALDGVDQPGLANTDLGGEVALVNVFASWCAPCRVEHPVLTRLAEARGIPLYGINYKDAPADAVAWLAELGNPYRRIGVDPEGRTGIELGLTGVPETYVVDADGRIRYRHAGPLTPRDVDDTLLPLIEEIRG
ncbi:MAG: DsbE family thiol:disulfide interchange protein [Alphaproteobacteria bacterium]|nr:DsbE family thiol:disulfide interchange protein [Alphaproteobacteria bacterium]